MAVKKKNWRPALIIFAGILVAGAILLAGYFLGQGFKLEIKKEATPSPEATPLAEASPASESSSDKTVNWETYLNSKYGYRFQHPQGWLFSPSVIGDETKPLYVIREELKSQPLDDFFIQIKTWDNPNQYSLTDWLQFMKDANALPLPADEIDLVANFTVAGEPAFKIWSDPLSKGQKPGKCFQACPILTVYFSHDNKAFSVEHVYLREVDEVSQETFRLLLATFQFLN